MSDPAAVPAGIDLDLRLVRYFTVVAEYENFGRAAVVLRVAQPSLSRQIQRLEDQLRVRLFDRTPQGSRLTEAGRAFLPRARAVLDAAHRAVLTARAAAPPETITIGYVGDLVITPAVRELRRSYPDADIRTRHLSWQHAHALAEHRVDALVARLPLPYSPDQVRVEVLRAEPRVLVVARSHPWAGKDSITLDQLDGAELVACTSTPTIWSVPRSGPDGSAPPNGPGAADSFEDKLELIATGECMAILPAGDRRPTLHAELVSIPLHGIEPCRVVVATHAEDRTPLTAAFRELARTHLVADV